MQSEQPAFRSTHITLRSLGETHIYSEQEISEYSRLEDPFIVHLTEIGLIGQQDQASQERLYNEYDLRLLRRAYRIQRDLDINQEAIEVILRLLRHIDLLQQALAQDSIASTKHPPEV
jgi:DNA-binding transcriptional MerR regulator